MKDMAEKEKPKKKKSGWFSCFSSAAEDKNIDMGKKGKDI